MGSRSKRPQRRTDEPPADPPSRDPAPWAALDGWIALGITCGTFIVYGATTCPTVGSGDSGEMASVVDTLGVAHPPGYPLYTMLAKLFSLAVPFGSVAFRINLFSALASALACGLMFRCVRRLTPSRSAGFLAATMMAFSPVFWRYSLVAEVFSLNSLFVVLLWDLAIRYEQEPRRNLPYGIFFVSGLGLSNHHTLLFYAVPVALWVLYRGREHLMRPRPCTLLGASLLAGFLPYLYLPLAGSQLPAVSWGSVTTLDGFVDHFLRRDYGTFRLALADTGSSVAFWPAIAKYLAHLTRQCLGVGWVFASIGVRWALRRRTQGAAVLTLSVFCFAFYLVVFQALANVPLDNPELLEVRTRFWIQGNILFFLWVGVGYGALSSPERGAKRVRSAVGFAVAVGIAAVQWGASYGESTERGNRTFFHYGTAVLDPLPADAILLLGGDSWVGAVRYLQECEGRRPDVAVLARDLIASPWYKVLIAKHTPNVTLPASAFHGTAGAGFDFKAFFDENIDRHPIFISPLTEDEKRDDRWTAEYEAFAVGMVLEVRRKGPVWTGRQYHEYSRAALPKFSPQEIAPFAHRPWVRQVWENYWAAYLSHVNRIAELIAKRPAEADEATMMLAVDLAKELVARHPRPLPRYFLSLGMVHFLASSKRPSLRRDAAAAWEHFLKIARADDPGRAIVGPLLRQLRESR